MKQEKAAKNKPRFMGHNRPGNGRNTPRNIFISHSFSDIEDSENAIQIIGALVKTAGENAAAEAKAAGLARTYVRGDRELVKVSADGSVTPIPATIQRTSFYIRYKPNTVLHAVKK